MRVAVIGAGIVGASVAFRLSQGGARVWLVEKAEPASGTTSASFAWLNANNKTPRDYFELNRASMEEHLRLRDELTEIAPWLHQSGNLIQVPDRDLEELRNRVRRLQSWGYAAEWRYASWAREKLEPHVAFQPPDAPVAYFPDEGWIDAPLLTNILVGFARRHGTEVHSGSEVQSIEMDSERISSIRIANGERIPVDVMVNAAGPGAHLVASLVGRKLPLTPRRGLLARIGVTGEFLRRILHTPRVNLRPDGSDHVLLHHSTVDEKLGESDEVQLAKELLGRAQEVIPALENAEVEEIREGTRPIPSDGHPCVGGVAAIPGYYEAVTYSGVTLGPLIGCLLAQEILTGEVDRLLVPFRPDRFES